MKDYVLEAIENFFEDEGIAHGEIDHQEDVTNIEWISGNVTYNQICEFERQFSLSFFSHEWDGENIINIEFYPKGSV